MKQNLNYIPIMIIAGLLLSGGVFELSVIPGSAVKQSAVVLQKQIFISVKTALPQQTLVPLRPAISNSNPTCFITSASSDLLQNVTPVNLNQPAGCFSLVQYRAVQLSAISVAQTTPSASVVVVELSGAAISPFTILPVPQHPDTALPVATAIFVTAFVFAETKKRFSATSRYKNFRELVTLHQLQVLRC